MILGKSLISAYGYLSVVVVIATFLFMFQLSTAPTRTAIVMQSSQEDVQLESVFTKSTVQTLESSVQPLISNVSENRQKYFIPEKDLFKKVVEFNKHILDWLARPHRFLSCESIVLPRNASYAIGRGNTNNWWQIFEHTRRLVGTQDFLKHQRLDSKELKAKLKSIGNVAALKNVLRTTSVYDVVAQHSGMKTFVLSSRSDAQSSVVDVQTLRAAYYNCHVTSRMLSDRWWTKSSGAMSPALCQNECSGDVTVLNQPMPLLDYAIHNQYTTMTDIAKCRDWKTPRVQLPTVAALTLHNDYTGDVLTSLDVITNGGTVFNEGQIRTTDNTAVRQWHCYTHLRDADEPLHQLDNINADVISCVDDVFVISDYYSLNFYHRLIDTVAEMAAFVPLLRQRPDIHIHVTRRAVPVTQNYLSVFGLRNRLITGVIKARTIYKPHGNGCFNPVLTHVQMANAYAHEYIRKHLLVNSDFTPPLNTKGTVVIIRRTVKRFFVNYDEVLESFQTLAAQTARELVVFDDSLATTFNDTLRMFYGADVIIGTHGAGLSNILASREGTTVIEVHCKGPQTRMCFRLLSLRLGMRYFATETTEERVKFRCNDNGIRVNITELNPVLDFVASYLK